MSPADRRTVRKIIFEHVDGRAYEIDISRHSARLAGASPEQKSHFVLSPSGYGIRWPDIDEDLSVDGLIGVSPARPVARSPRPAT